MKKEDFEKVKKQLESFFVNLSEDDVQWMQTMTFKLGILVALLQLVSSSDYEEIAKQIQKDKGEDISLPFIREIVAEYYPELQKEGLISEGGVPTQEARYIAARYLELLNEY